MPSFSYIAMNAQGKEIKGTMEAEGRTQAIARLKSEGSIPIQLTEASILQKDIQVSILDKKVTSRDLAVFCRQFVSIVSAGVPVTSALEMLAEQTENRMLSAAIHDCHGAIQGGMSLSEAMSKHRKLFGDLFITMVAAGEESGSLEISFERMAQQFEKEEKLKNLVKKATVYPTIVSLVAVAVLIVLLTFVVPQFEQMLTDMDMELPAVTQMVIVASEFVQTQWYIILAVIVAAVLLIRYAASTHGGKRVLGRLELRVPLFGNLAVKTASARMSRTMSTLLAAGIPITDALEIVSRTMSNVFFREALVDAREDVAMGTPLSEPIAAAGLFPPMVQHMTKIGEEVGDLEGMLDRVADYYDEEVEVATEALTAALEPAIIIILALMVGTVVIAIMLPMASMYEGLGNL